MELTTRQKVLQLRDKGLSVREIAKELDLSTQGIHYHLNADKEGRPTITTTSKTKAAS